MKLKHPWTNGQIESMNKKIKQKVLTRYIFSDEIDLEKKLIEFINDYKMNAKLKSIDSISPKEYLMRKHNIIIQPIVS